MKLLFLLALYFGVAQASFFDFIQNQFHNANQPRQSNFEVDKLNIGCNQYLCADTLQCVEEPKLCPCPFPSSQLRCFLPNGNYLCISKPAGDIASKYDDPTTNWKVDAKDDDVRDCGWVSRKYKGI